MTHAAQPHAAPQTSAFDLLKVLCIAVIPRAFKGDGEGKGEAPNRAVSFPLYWIAFNPEVAQSDLLEGLQDVLTDPLQEELWHATADERMTWLRSWRKGGFRWFAERQFLPGVTDNLARTVEEALSLKGLPAVLAASGTGHLFGSAGDGSGGRAQPSQDSSPADGGAVAAEKPALFETAEDLEQYARYRLYHPVTDRLEVHDLLDTRIGELLDFPNVRLRQSNPAKTINLELSDAELEELSKQRLLALSKAEMRAIRQYYMEPATRKQRSRSGMPEMPTDVELEIIAQTWSEHCKHKIFNARISHTDMAQTPGHQVTTIASLYKTYIQAATKSLHKQRPDLLSVFEDNSGVVQWNDKWAVCFKVETHNSPSALEPYGGALTGILGVNRDVLGTGLGARPLFNTDVFCFAYPAADLPSRPSLLPPKALLDGVRKGVEDGGNKSGIPTVNGAIFFDPGFRAKPLVFCGTGGLLPIEVDGVCAYKKHTTSGDTIVMAGGRVGKDGIHGATFSSESLNTRSPVSAVQIGDPFTQKRLLDFVIEARDAGLITGITDNGAGGLSSSVGEMATITGGATIELDNVPTKYPGLADWEVVVSESQERMTISTRRFDELKLLADKHTVEISDIGKFHNQGYFEVRRSGKAVALLDLKFLHDGVPTLELESEWRPSQITMNTGAPPPDLAKVLLNLLSHPNIASREQVIRQYDHEVQGLSVIKPLMGGKQAAPCDAAVLLPMYGETSALAVSNGINPRLAAHDCFLMAQCVVDEAIRNAVCVGADPATISLLDNFCWPDPVLSIQNPRGKAILAQLVRACQGLYDAVTVFETPLISGKDSMKNDFDDGVLRLSIPPTLLVSAIGKVHDVESCLSMEFKCAGDVIYLLSTGIPGLAASHYEEIVGWQSPIVPMPDLPKAKEMYRRLHRSINSGFVHSAHDLSEGGLAVALSECIIGSGLGAYINLDKLTESARQHADNYPAPPTSQRLLYRLDTVLFGEGPSRIIVSVPTDRKKQFQSLWGDGDCIEVGVVTDKARLTVDYSSTPAEAPKTVLDLTAAELESAWKSPLPFD
jgi:phosphoribosylformylglycinamidine synthase